MSAWEDGLTADLKEIKAWMEADLLRRSGPAEVARMKSAGRRVMRIVDTLGPEAGATIILSALEAAGNGTDYRTALEAELDRIEHA
jgi:hypothetical protein